MRQGGRIWHVWERGALDEGFCCRNLREGNSLEDKNRSRTGPDSVDWSDLAQDRDKCWAFVNTATNFWSHKMLIILEEMRHYHVLQKASVHTVS